VTEEAAQHIVKEVREYGTVLERWEVDPVVAELIRGLHSKAWFQVAGRSSVVSTSTGGRQGCKLGGLVFALDYDQALHDMREKLNDAGIAVKFRVAKDDPFWLSAEHSTTFTPDAAVEVTFVDDEAAAIVASSPAVLDRGIEIITNAYCNAFRKYNLQINWKRGKSEAMIKYRGRRATQRLDAHRSPDGKCIRINDTDRVFLVDHYKHLGGIITSDGIIMPEVNLRASSAMSTYGPLATRVFGSSAVSVTLKKHFLQSLVMSKLLYNVQTLTMTIAGLRKLNDPYMRALRRIFGEPRHDEHCTNSDRQVRRALGMPSIDCVVLQKRLVYYSRIAMHRPTMLWALLQARVESRPLPYIEQVHTDLSRFYDLSRDLRARLPPLQDDPASWMDFLVQNSEGWKAMAYECAFIDSCLDSVDSGEREDSCTNVHRFVCSICLAQPRPAFSTEKALSCHMRSKHGMRSPVKQYIDGTGICPVCGTNFLTRIRVIAHLSDVRRPKCRNVLLSGSRAPLPPSVQQALEELDRTTRREALQAGHTHPIAYRSARTKDGKRIGYVSR
jgi:hypothetical protein